MDFKTATDGLFNRLPQAELAKALGVSVATIRQARLSDGNGRRSPPLGWEDAVIRLAEQRVAYYRDLVHRLRQERRRDPPICSMPRRPRASAA
jgi:hypothetical protein